MSRSCSIPLTSFIVVKINKRAQNCFNSLSLSILLFAITSIQYQSGEMSRVVPEHKSVQSEHVPSVMMTYVIQQGGIQLLHRLER
ncbi:unnamed protein product [Sympodiomycopsis kandeliae]